MVDASSGAARFDGQLPDRHPTPLATASVEFVAQTTTPAIAERGNTGILQRLMPAASCSQPPSRCDADRQTDDRKRGIRQMPLFSPSTAQFRSTQYFQLDPHNLVAHLVDLSTDCIAVQEQYEVAHLLLAHPPPIHPHHFLKPPQQPTLHPVFP